MDVPSSPQYFCAPLGLNISFFNIFRVFSNQPFPVKVRRNSESITPKMSGGISKVLHEKVRRNFESISSKVLSLKVRAEFRNYFPKKRLRGIWKILSGARKRLGGISKKNYTKNSGGISKVLSEKAQAEFRKYYLERIILKSSGGIPEVLPPK